MSFLAARLSQRTMDARWRLVTYFKTSSMKMTGMENQNTAFHSS